MFGSLAIICKYQENTLIWIHLSIRTWMILHRVNLLTFTSDLCMSCLSDANVSLDMKILDKSSSTCLASAWGGSSSGARDSWDCNLWRLTGDNISTSSTS